MTDQVHGRSTVGAVSIALRPVSVHGEDREALIAFLTGEPWNFHVRPHPTREQVESSLADGGYDGPDNHPLWVMVDGERVGLAVLQDLVDDTPMFDLRLTGSVRGRGLGTPVLRALTTHLFQSVPTARRFEGQTREDNIAMRRVFLRSGFVKEAHYRQAWPVPGGQPLASVAYAVLRQDWETGQTTPLRWDDLDSSPR